MHHERSTPQTPPPSPSWTADEGARLQANLLALVDYYATTPGVGHTTLLLEGTRHVPPGRRPVLVGVTLKEAERLAQASGQPRGAARSWSMLGQTLRGCRAPLALDHAVVHTMARECLAELARLTRGLADLEQRLARAEEGHTGAAAPLPRAAQDGEGSRAACW